MNGVDSPFHTLTFNNQVNLGPLLSATITNLWPYLAIATLTAAATTAVTLWRLYFPAHASVVPVVSDNQPPEALPDSVKKSDLISGVPEMTPCGGLETKKEKLFFTVCYDYSEEENNREDDEVEEEEETMDVGYELMVVKRRGEWTAEISEREDVIGWYAYQDRGVIDGSVVKLWENQRGSGVHRRCRRRITSPVVFTFN